MNKIKIAPSILSADFLNFERDIRKLEKSGADLIHIDVMDGSFVPNITFGMGLVKQIGKITSLPLDCHLMIVNPDKYIERFAEAGADYITIHYEASGNLKNDLTRINNLGVFAGLSLNPDTPVRKIFPYLKYVDLILVMSVFPGFGGQKFIAESIDRIVEIKNFIMKNKYDVKIEVDGGVNEVTAPLITSAGADILVAGAAVFSSKNQKQIIKNLRK
ncbi:MAG: ribulose-phosphate 3-epimerase [Candidatus Firestonebacteria bacterium RIFOXYC2_FULL_39_67]|nr:MAG: ribulose-phosphate 3-epimerase [Candidatus Firestonebacteria bacterium RIFOXYD2_FULL_39_29]OGF53971.1 MAG: ribulose-phosphate 3-epimerase [Candidatus Firestonebacteria bacterium RIFOXYC2_FULL_39_67]OGF56555.1 MAG: ribulose-phosphate 3-epimerase [Candidatus Firestonebacteria bacterium RifOxyC12_full_39_7]